MAVIVVANDGKAAGTVVKNEAFGDTVYHNTIERIDLISTLSLHVNETITLEPSLYPLNDQTTLTWYSNNSVVASVSQSGVVTAHSVGTAVVSVRAGNGTKALCTVAVTSSTPDPVGLAWIGTYNVTSSVDRGYVSDYDYPTEFSIMIYEHDGAFFVTGMVGMVLDSTIYEGLKVNILDEQHAEIDLSYSYELGYRTFTGGLLKCLYMISPQSTFLPEVLEEDKIAITRNPDGTLVIDDFYIFAFGLISDYKMALDANYHNVRCKSTKNTSSSITSAIVDFEEPRTIGIYNINGMLVYSGNEYSMPQLAPGIYIIFREGSSTQRILVP